jgi:hypothetical protein
MLDLKACVCAPVADEFAGAELGDARRTRRLQKIAERALSAPDVGFPRMVHDDSELEGLYRFFATEEVTPESVLAPHFAATVERMRQVQGPVLVAHDTTDLRFGGLHAREGLGLTNGKQQGFFLHLALAILPGEERLALGTCGMLQLCRTEPKHSATKSSREMAQDPQRESLRWSQLVDQVEDRCSGTDCIHLMDREGDKFDLLALLLRGKSRFVVRGHYDRVLATGVHLHDLVANLKPRGHREIALSERLDDGRRTTNKHKHPPRNGRSARIAVAGCVVKIRSTESSHAAESELTLNVVRIWEPKPPSGEPPVSWMLYTSEPIDTVEQLLAIVDHYRSRWLIEEFFKALKTGCAFEKRQLESYSALSIALGVFLPVAWRLLLARSVSRLHPDAPASTVATPVQLQLLCHKLKLKTVPTTAQEATYAIAKLGGHLKRNGPPGWITLGQGFESLLPHGGRMESGYGRPEMGSIMRAGLTPRGTERASGLCAPGVKAHSPRTRCRQTSHITNLVGETETSTLGARY